MEDYSNLTPQQLEEKLKEERRKREMAFDTYLKMYADAARMEEERLKKEADGKPSLSEVLTAYLLQTLTLLDNIVAHDGALADFFDAAEPPETRQRRDRFLSEMDIRKSEFHALAISVCAKEPDFVQNAQQIFRGTPPQTPALVLMRSKSLSGADSSIESFRAGDQKPLKNLLKDGLLIGCYQFVQAKDPLDIIHWGRHLCSILGVITSHQSLLQGPEYKKLLEDATGAAAMGQIMESGYHALMEIQKLAVEGKEPEPLHKQELLSRVLLMQEVEERRTSEKYRNAFARGFHPRKGLSPELFSAVIEKLERTPAIQQISRMSITDHALCLTNRTTRSRVSIGLFKEMPLGPLFPGDSKKELNKEPPHKEPPAIAPRSLWH